MMPLVLICSCRGHEKQRARIRDTWLADCEWPYLFVVGDCDHLSIQDDVLCVESGDGYPSLPWKMRDAYQCAWRLGYRRVFKCDDDTYVAAIRLAKAIPNWHYVGQVRNPSAQYPHAYGGAGYWLDGEALRVLVDVAGEECWWNIHPTPIPCEDATVGRLLNDAGMPPEHDDRYRGKPGEGVPSPNNGYITGHNVSAEQMRSVHQMIQGVASDPPT